MSTQLRFSKTVKVEKPLNRAQRILRKNRETFPKWYWRLLQDRSFEIMEFSWYIPRADVTIDKDGYISSIALANGTLTKES